MQDFMPVKLTRKLTCADCKHAINAKLDLEPGDTLYFCLSDVTNHHYAEQRITRAGVRLVPHKKSPLYLIPKDSFE